MTIAAFAADRRADLWSGVGLAAAYAGGMDRPRLESLAISAGAFHSHVAQGAAFAAQAHARAGNPADHTDLACKVFCGLDAAAAAAVTVQALDGLRGADPAFRSTSPDGSPRTRMPAYERWRACIRDSLPPRALGTSGSAS